MAGEAGEERVRTPPQLSRFPARNEAASASSTWPPTWAGRPRFLTGKNQYSEGFSGLSKSQDL